MMRRDFLNSLPLLGTIGPLNHASALDSIKIHSNDRSYWLEMLTRISNPVLTALSHGELKKLLPVESTPGETQGRKQVTHLEAFGRTLAGLAPWLELGPDNTMEGSLRIAYIQLAVYAIQHAVNPSSPDYLNFTNDKQPLVDAAFLAHALIRAPKHLWGNLDEQTQQQLIAALLSTRTIKPYESNGLLFSAMIEAAIYKFSNANYNAIPVTYAMEQHKKWYKGDGVYGDGPDFHFDYYNSFVIQPMMLDIARVLRNEPGFSDEEIATLTHRAKRYAEIQERMISPEGAFPPVGRSLAYRCGAFQLLAQMALQRELPASLPPAQVRSALTAVIKRSLDDKNTFDKNGWLTIGFCGHQPTVGEFYISTGSLYLCTVAFLPLGLPVNDPFWSAPALDWTSKKAYSGKDFPIDKAI